MLSGFLAKSGPELPGASLTFLQAQHMWTIRPGCTSRVYLSLLFQERPSGHDVGLESHASHVAILRLDLLPLRLFHYHWPLQRSLSSMGGGPGQATRCCSLHDRKIALDPEG